MKQSNHLKGKTQQEKLDYLNALQYSIVLKKKGDNFSLIIPELSLVVLNENLDKAYSELHEQKQKLFMNMLECEAEDEIQTPKKGLYTQDTFHQLKLFVYKLLIICVLGGITLTVSGALLVNKVSNISFTHILTEGGLSMFREFEKFEKRFFDVSEVVKQKRIKKFQGFVESLKPYTQELQPLFLPSPYEGNSKDKEDYNK